MNEEAIFFQFKIIADKKKKPNGMASRVDIISSIIELCVERCLSIKNENPNHLIEFKIKEEVIYICRTLQKRFQYPDEMITEFIMPNVKKKLGR